jgi:chromosome transmission fidelity protein 4
MEEMAALGLDTTSYDDESFNMEAGLDRCILRLISSCCSGTRLELEVFINFGVI